jgi:AmmeMemoRadiSam system protein A
MLDSILLQIAKAVILDKLEGRHEFKKDALKQNYPFLNDDGASFVTLKYKGELRGCIGSVVAHKTLLDDVVNNASSAAFSDPRFLPLSEDELNDLVLEVSVLTQPQLIDYDDYNDLKSKIDADVDGLILKYGSYQGTFLPQVWEQLKSKDDFLEHLSYKSGTNPAIYEKHPEIYKYQVEAIEEDFNEILPI